MRGEKTTRRELEAALALALSRRKWFGGGTREVERVRIADEIPVASRTNLAILEVAFAEGQRETYVLSLAHDESDLNEALLAAIAGNRDIPGGQGELRARSTPAFEELGGLTGGLDPQALPGEQTNTSVVFGNRFVLKLIRRLEPGESPELEVGRVLTERGFARVRPLAGWLEYVRGGGEPATVGILHGYRRGEGDLFTELTARLSSEEGPRAGHATARLLGTRTAELHRALSTGEDRPAFRPVADGPEYRAALLDSRLDLADRVFRRLGPDHEEMGKAVRKAFRDEAGIDGGMRIRGHGDYHLGQVLRSGDDLVIIDFEGEPERPLPERRRRHSPLKDVAGMLRSFHYAAYVGSKSVGEELVDWGREWVNRVSAAFLESYLAGMEGTGLLPPAEERGAVLAGFELGKAVYEIGYELAHRPKWVGVPLAGAAEILERGEG